MIAKSATFVSLFLFLVAGWSEAAQNSQYAVLLHGHNKSAPCSLAALRWDHRLTYLTESLEEIYPRATRQLDGVQADHYCLYQSSPNEANSPIITLLVDRLIDKIKGVAVLSRQAQFLVPEQDYTNSTELRLDPFQEVPQAEDRQATTPPGQYNLPRMLKLRVITDKSLAQQDGEQMLPNLLITLATSEQMMRAIGLRLRLAQLDRWSSEDRFEITGDISKTLSNLGSYRVTSLPANETRKHDSMHLFTGHVQDSRGKAYIGGVCRHLIGVSTTSTAHRDNLVSRAAAFSHEQAHLLGVSHDRPSWRENAQNYHEICSCPDQDCIMTPSMADPGPIRWSNCSMASLTRNIHAYETAFTCLLPQDGEQPVSWVASRAICGNGVVEPGEDCDKGLEEGVHNLGALAVLDALPGACNPLTCQFIKSSSVDDRVEKRPLCPWMPGASTDTCCQQQQDQFVQSEDGRACPGGVCKAGFCQSHSAQCRRTFGSEFFSAAPDVYAVNGGKNWSSGFCQYRAKSIGEEQYDFDLEKCPTRDRECGALLCSDGTDIHEENLHEKRFDSLIKHTISMSGGQHEQAFFSAIQDRTLSTGRDPLLAPNGAQCGPGQKQRCLDGKCLPSLE